MSSMTTKDLLGLRERVIRVFVSHGFTVREGILIRPDAVSKDEIRKLHALSRMERIPQAGEWILKREHALMEYFAAGKEVIPEAIYPELEPVDSPLKAELFRNTSLLWSIPLSAGYGRRLRFPVFDGSNGKLMGLLALGHPV